MVLIEMKMMIVSASSSFLKRACWCNCSEILLCRSHVGIRNVPLDVCYDDTKHYQVPSENQGRCKVHKKKLLGHCIKCRVNLNDIRFFYKKPFFSIQPRCCLNFSWIELQILFSCCLVHISIIILRRFSYLLYFCPCLMSRSKSIYIISIWSIYRWNIKYIFIFIFIFIMTDHVILWIRTNLFFRLFFRICPIISRWQRGWRIRIIFK